MLLKRQMILAMALIGVTACQSMPPDALRLSQSAMQTRAVQTRQFVDTSEVQILSASVGVLQDLGYAIDEIEKPLGVLSASKRADATNEAQVTGRVALDVASCLLTFLIACDNENYKKSDDVQDIRLTLVVLPASELASSYSVRVTIQRVVWDRDGRISEQSTIDEPVVYQEFFAKLNKSVHLEKSVRLERGGD